MYVAVAVVVADAVAAASVGILLTCYDDGAGVLLPVLATAGLVPARNRYLCDSNKRESKV